MTVMQTPPLFNPEDDFWRKSMKLLEDGIKLKGLMLKKGIRYAKTHCPWCKDTKGGMLYMTLNGRKNHAHAHCDKCDAQFME